MNKHRKTATLALTAGIALFGLAGCSHARGHGPYAGKDEAWFYLHPKALQAQWKWYNKHVKPHLTKAQRNSNAYGAKHYPTSFDAGGALILMLMNGSQRASGTHK